MRKSLSVIAVAMSLVAMATPSSVKAAQVADFNDQLNAIEDEQLRRTLSNSIAVGLISTDEELQNAISQAIDSAEEDQISFEVSRKKPKHGNKPKPNKKSYNIRT